MATAIASHRADHLMRPSNAPGPDLRSHDTIILAFLRGKDSVACLLLLIEVGVRSDASAEIGRSVNVTNLPAT
jgi:hypothetical protein